MNDLPQISSTSYAQALGVANQAGMAGLGLNQFGMQGVLNHPIIVPQEKPKVAFTSRLVKVFIADTDENVPLEKRLLYRGDELFTDLTDQELFFEVPITDLLSKHNEFRLTLKDKKASKEKDVFLEPIRVRDLKMLVVALANF